MKRKKTERERERKRRDTTSKIYNINNNHGLFNEINNKKNYNNL